MNAEPLLNIIYLESRMLLSKKIYSGWREIQDEFADYKSSLGPWPAEEVLDFLHNEYPSDPAFSRERIAAFLRSNEQTMVA